MAPRFTIGDLQLLATGLDHPEGVACARDGRVFAGGEAGQIYEVAREGRHVREVASTGGFVLGLALDADDDVYACDLQRAEVVRIRPSGEVTTYSHVNEDDRLRSPNYPMFDSAGNLYVSDSGTWGRRDGRIWRISPGGRAEVWDVAAADFPNGLALDSDDANLYVVESTLPGITRIRINRDGSAGAREVVRAMPGTVPDGLAFDEEGNAYISCYRPDRIYVMTRNASLEILVDDPTAQVLNAPTNIAFAGPDLDHLVIASLGGWELRSLPVPARGRRLHYPVIST